ncbi:hypothetical protein BGY98DRAFT_995222, partial [Russula aff. rugulosa BPL654]
WSRARGAPIASFTRLVGANVVSIVAGKAVWKARRGESGREESKEMVGSVGTGTYLLFASRPTTIHSLGPAEEVYRFS